MTLCLCFPHTKYYMCLRVWENELRYCPVIGYNGKEIRYESISWLICQSNNTMNWKAWILEIVHLSLSWSPEKLGTKIWSRRNHTRRKDQLVHAASVCFLQLCQATRAIGQFVQLTFLLSYFGLFLNPGLPCTATICSIVSRERCCAPRSRD